ncbi:3-oxoacyl-[acyl-carrier-protein] reductase [Clostridium sp. AM49-4BH]|uniref:3-oxoacyl-[acyl-carrier-protein] reductase n=1 Tax=Clostridium sp. AM49-4BH TaxID=2293035 RepID=UPI000E4CBAB6|nr:3-oxoacyl-[acyl-carrier-protein] reductase [Clostridium sp. AM49-4BH]RHQ13641.1 3-oxoacyl-[acyl-carrier-protein] reductase [Clostridium sp. AM49-4BH]
MLQGKTAVVTGAAKGIGKAIALAFAKEGCNIVLNYHSSLDDETVQEIEACGVTCMPVQGDVSDFAFAADMMKKVKKELGSVDILVNNAGITKDMLLMRMTEEQFDSVIQTNLKGTFNMIRHASSIMLKQRSGAIINMSSVVGVMGNVGQANYAASKAGIIGLTKSTAKELAARGVTCNAIAPGFVETDMTAALSEDLQKQMLETIPLKRYGQVDDIAQAAVFLAKNTYITGQVLNVDGGMCM